MNKGGDNTLSEERCPYLLNPTQIRDTIDTQTHSGFVEIRTRAGKLIFRLDPSRKLVEWREGKQVELVDISPFMPQ